MSVEPTRLELLELDIDLRLSDLWEEAGKVGAGDWTLKLVAGFMRTAYARGRDDAMIERKPGAYYKQNGYPMPKREKAGAL